MSHNPATRSTLSFIYNAARAFPVPMLIMGCTSIIWAVDLSLRPYLLKVIIDRVSDPATQDVFESVGATALLYFAMIFIYPTVFRVNGYFIEVKMIPNLRRNIASTSFGSLLKQSYSYYQNNFAGSLASKLNNLTSDIPDIIQIVFESFFSNALGLVIATFTLWQVSYVFAAAMLVWTAVTIIIAFVFADKLSTLSARWAECAAAITGSVVDSLSNALSVQLFARSNKEASVVDSSCGYAVKAEQKLKWTHLWLWAYFGYSVVAVQGVGLYFLLKGRQEGWITPGDFVVVLGINFEIAYCLRDLTKDFSKFSQLWGRISQALTTIQITPEILDAPDAKPLVVTQGRIIFDKVKFHYKGARPLFENKSVIIEPGQKVGLVGYSGGGKSTFVNLVLRMYDITGGKITIDGQDISKVTQESLRGSIATIPQDPSLFHRSIMENIRYGRIEASDEEVIQAAKRAHAHEFIINLPDKYDSLVGERGVKLSGGQRQRIAIARAILKGSPILMLDEATSQLDSITEKYIQEGLQELMQGKTTIVIAHRLSTLMNMDRILVFEWGEVVEDDPH